MIAFRLTLQSKSTKMKKSKLIYYLDDDRDDLRFFKDSAESLGHRVLTFLDAHEMLLMLRNNVGKPDFIFLDIHMPILNGEEILNIIKNSAHWKHIPVVMISGAYPKKLVRHFMDVGVNYLMKRPLMNDMKAALDQVLKSDMNRFQEAG